MSFDLAALLRRYKPERHVRPLRPRPIEALVEAAPGVARTVLLDTTAIIHGLAGRLPSGTAEMVRAARQFHCSVCLGEIAVGLGHYDPAAADAAPIKAGYLRTFAAISRHRIIAPTSDIWMGAGVIAGTLALTQHFGRNQRRALMNDALIYPTAAKFGLPVLTENRREFDLIQQVAGHGRFIFYEAGDGEPGTA